MKKKHYYNKEQFGIKVQNNPNSIDLLRAIRKDKTKKETIWLDFMNDYVFNKKKCSIDNKNNLAIILSLIHSRQTIQKIIYFLYNKDYIPNKNNIPLCDMPDDLYNIIRKKQNYINKFYFYKQEYDNTIVLFHKKEDVDFFKDKYENIICLSGEYTYIYTKKINKIYTYLETIEPNTWVIKDDYIYNWKNKTKFNFLNKDTIEDIERGVL